MKKLLAIFILSLLLTLTSFAQTFEGKITYSNSYVSKNEKVSDQQWNLMMGTTQEYLIKDGNYRSSFNGSLLEWQLYINKDNKLYNKMANSETIFWNDCSIQGDEVLKVELNKNVAEVLGYKCDEVILTCKSGIQKYYFNSGFSVDTKLFVNHKFGNWYDYLLKSNSLPLKSITETAQFTMTSIATEVKAMNLESKLFALPSGATTEKFPN
ncbi:MAG: hypothetical protein M3R17_14490 [Bacteroidota bacterium]|nr:hypothetical protein [Bacteroidota bacterium]